MKLHWQKQARRSVHRFSLSSLVIDRFYLRGYKSLYALRTKSELMRFGLPRKFSFLHLNNLYEKSSILLLLTLCFAVHFVVFAAKRPNVVFLVSEDNSIHYLKHYGYGANSDPCPISRRWLRMGLTFNHAFSNSPGLLGRPLDSWPLGYARSEEEGSSIIAKSSMATLASRLVKPWTALLRKAGYYCHQQFSKTDYNFVHNIRERLWNESSRKASSWRKRPEKNMHLFSICSRLLSLP